MSAVRLCITVCPPTGLFVNHTTDFLEGSIDFPQDNAPASPNETGDTFTFPLQPVTDAPVPITFGTLTEWGEWRCTRHCSVKDLIRIRDCIPTADNRGCDGALVEYKHSSCHVNKCPEGCPPQYFGEDCKHKCIQCTTDCDKFYGTCPACFPGYDYPETGCLLDRREYKDWTRWECSENCNNPYLVRKRMCKEAVAREGNKTCMQPIIDVRPGLCHIGKKCFKHCPSYKWGDNCSNSCENCEQPCNKLNGVCESCDAGYQRPQNACQMPCKHYYYGINCTGSCIDKCGEDCIERVYGECRPSSINNTVLMFAILTVPVAIFVYFVIKRKKEEEEMAATKSMISLKSGASKSKQSLLSQSRSKQSLKSSTSKGSLHGGAKMKSKSQTSLKVTPSVEV
ncbi:hypothetical protein Btru_014750 [Bulinus truncatus]|nr:hypothetical protein Btru_014750 [Bulinus truncatus]